MTTKLKSSMYVGPVNIFYTETGYCYGRKAGINVENVEIGKKSLD